MKVTIIRSILTVLILISLTSATTSLYAADPCNPASVIAKANALKSSGDVRKDMAALIELAKLIQNTNSACLPDDSSEVAPAGSGTRQNPVPLGKTMRVVFENSTFDVRIHDVTRGTLASIAVKKANPFNDVASAGMQYLVAQVDLTYIKGSEDKAKEINTNFFKSLSKLQFVTSDVIVPPQPDVDFKGFPGATHTGWIALEVFIDDPNPMIFVSTDYDKGLFFATW